MLKTGEEIHKLAVAQTVTLWAHNAYFYRLRISKYPANARQTINFPARPSIYTIFGIRMTGGRLRRRGSVLFPGSGGGHSL